MLLVLAVTPILLVPQVPLHDLPNHVARQYIILNLQHDPVLRQFYTVSWALVPNLGLEMVNLLLGPLLGVAASARCFCVLVLGTIFIGTRSINRQIGGPGAFAYRLAPLFSYCGPFQFGFLSFCLGIGASLLAFGLYLRLRNSRGAIRIPCLAAAGTLVLLIHVAPFLIFALVVSGFQFSISARQYREEGWFRFLLGLVIAQARLLSFIAPPIILLLLAQIDSGGPDGTLRWASPIDKLAALAAMTMYALPWAEIPMLVLAFVGAAVAFRRGWVRLDPRGAGVLLFLVLAFALTPRGGLGGAMVDYRFPSAAIFFVLGFIVPGSTIFPGSAIVPGSMGAAETRTLHYWFGGLIAARVASIAVLWLGWQPVLAEFDAAFARLPLGARLEVIVGPRASTLEERSPPLHHVAARAVTLRQAFEPDIFADLTGHVLQLTPQYRPFRRGTLRNRLDSIDPVYSHLLVIYPDTAWISPDVRLTTLFVGRAFILSEVARPSP